MDHIDRKIIQLLSANGRLSFAEIGRVVNLSTPAAHRRVRALEERGVIAGYAAKVDTTTLGPGLSALVAIEAVGDLDALVASLESIPEVETCWSTAGTSDLLLKVGASSAATLERLLVRIRATAGVDRTRTTVLLNTRFERQPDPGVLLAGTAGPAVI